MAADPGASHARKGRPSPATRDLLAAAHAALRDELSDTLAELRPEPVAARELTIGDPMPKGRPELPDRVRLVGLIGDLMKLLGTEIVPAPATPTPDALTDARPRRRRRVDYG